MSHRDQVLSENKNHFTGLGTTIGGGAVGQVVLFFYYKKHIAGDFFSFDNDMYLYLAYVPPHSGHPHALPCSKWKKDISRF